MFGLSVWLQVIFCTCVKETVFFSFLRSLLRENGRSLRFPTIFIKKNKLGDRMIKKLLNSVIAKYLDLSVSRRSIICLSLRLRKIIGLLATDKSRYFAQPRPIIVNYYRIRLSCDVNNADLGGCYPSPPSSSVDNILRDLHNSSHHTRPHSII